MSTQSISPDTGENIMTDEPTDLIENEHLRQWLETTRAYLFTDMNSLPRTSVKASDNGAASITRKQDTRNTAIARKKDQRRRMVRRAQTKSKDQRSSTMPPFSYVLNQCKCFVM